LEIEHIPSFFPHNAAYKTRRISQWPVFPGNGFDERRFSRTIGANDSNVLTYIYLEGNRIKDLSSIAGNGDIPEIYQGLRVVF
jgi:hypothetical protein